MIQKNSEPQSDASDEGIERRRAVVILEVLAGLRGAVRAQLSLESHCRVTTRSKSAR